MGREKRIPTTVLYLYMYYYTRVLYSPSTCILYIYLMLKRNARARCCPFYVIFIILYTYSLMLYIGIRIAPIGDLLQPRAQAVAAVPVDFVTLRTVTPAQPPVACPYGVYRIPGNTYMTRGVRACNDVDRLQGKHDRRLALQVCSCIRVCVCACCIIMYKRQISTRLRYTPLISVEKPFALFPLPTRLCFNPVFVSRRFLFRPDIMSSILRNTCACAFTDCTLCIHTSIYYNVYMLYYIKYVICIFVYCICNFSFVRKSRRQGEQTF